jgi:hypothetical protein
MGLGLGPVSGSALSQEMVISGKSVRQLVNRICPGRRGRKSQAPAMLNIVPKSAPRLT